MSKKKALTAFVSLLLAATLGLTLETHFVKGPSERIAGVKEGDWIKYGNFLATWSSNDPRMQRPPLDLIDHNNTEWATNTVKTISGTKITFQTLIHYKNGTEKTSTSYVDVNTGDGDGNGTFMFVSANLGLGEKVYDSREYVQTWINETIQLVYADALRETNYLKAMGTQFVPSESGEDQNYVYQIEYFWDKATGALSERAGTLVNSTGSYGAISIKSEVMLETNLWEAAPDTTPPTAEAGPDQTVTVNQIVNFDAEDSTDNEGGWGIASYEWDFGGGTKKTGMHTTHTYEATGEYTVTLTVKDWAGNSDTDTLNVTVQEAPSSPPDITGIVVVVALLITVLFFFALKGKK